MRIVALGRISVEKWSAVMAYVAGSAKGGAILDASVTIGTVEGARCCVLKCKGCLVGRLAVPGAVFLSR